VVYVKCGQTLVDVAQLMSIAVAELGAPVKTRVRVSQSPSARMPSRSASTSAWFTPVPVSLSPPPERPNRCCTRLNEDENQAQRAPHRNLRPDGEAQHKKRGTSHAQIPRSCQAMDGRHQSSERPGGLPPLDTTKPAIYTTDRCLSDRASMCRGEPRVTTRFRCNARRTRRPPRPRPHAVAAQPSTNAMPWPPRQRFP
jgi:hypothetical protein